MFLSAKEDIGLFGLLLPFQDHEGYPSGSMVDFACDDNGSPILAVSSLAVHSKVWLSLICYSFFKISHVFLI